MNACLTALWAGLALVQAPEPVDLGALRIGDREVPVVLPPASAPPDGPVIRHNGWSFAVREDGTLSAPFRVDGAWGDVAELWRRAQAYTGPKAEWRVRIMVFSRGEVLRREPDGLIRTHRFSLERREIDHVYRSLALAKVKFEGLTGGGANVLFDVTVEQDPIEVFVDAPSKAGELPLVAARTNSQSFETDEGRFSGPYALTEVIHCLPGAAMGGIAYFEQRPASRPLQLAQTLAQRLVASVRDVAGRNGLRVGWLDGTLWSDSAASVEEKAALWAALGGGSATAEIAARLFGAPLDPALGWTQVRHEWPRLPEAPEGAIPPRPGVAKAVEDGRRTISLTPAEADLLAARSDPGFRLLPLGRDGERVVFQIEGAPEGATVASLAGFAGPSPRAAAAQPLRVLDPPRAEGTFSLEARTDPERGPVIAVTDRGHYRDGGALLADGPDQAIDLLAPGPDGRPMALRFWARTSSPIPFAIRADGPDGEPIGWVSLGPPRQPMPWVAFEPRGAWQQVRIPLAAFATPPQGPRLAGSFWLAPATTDGSTERGGFGPATIDLAGFEIVPLDGPAPEVAPAGTLWGATPAAIDAAAWGRSASAPTSEQHARLVAMALDGTEVERLNALDALARWPDPVAAPALVDASRSASPATAYLALRALAAAGTDEAWTRIREATLHGPFDHARRFGAQVLGAFRRPRSAATLSTLLTAQAWTSRLAAAVALTHLADPEAPNVALVYLRDPEPVVRLATVRGIRLEDDLIGRRILFSAVNDTSEAVRLAAWLRLMESGRPEWRGEAVRAIRNETLANREALARHIGGWDPSDEAAATAMGIALSDPNPTVRAALVARLGAAGLSAASRVRETILADGSPFVQREVLLLARDGAAALPEEYVRTVAQSAYPKVAEHARRLLGLR
jgi:HEAT repeat protein